MLITAAVPEIPDELLRQLKPGGRAVLPIGPPLGVQELVLVEKGADGKTVQLTDYRGKVVLLNFWATWCGPCKYEIPWFVEFERPGRQAPASREVPSIRSSPRRRASTISAQSEVRVDIPIFT
jgi:cytochrome c biogenesis protein CcmG/thiol:disulfide interchange protein DsbE